MLVASIVSLRPLCNPRENQVNWLWIARFVDNVTPRWRCKFLSNLVYTIIRVKRDVSLQYLVKRYDTIYWKSGTESPRVTVIMQMKNVSLTLQSLASFKVKLYLAHASQKQECTNTDTVSEQKNAFTVLAAEGRGMSENSSIKLKY